jgi:TolB protein
MHRTSLAFGLTVVLVACASPHPRPQAPTRSSSTGGLPITTGAIPPHGSIVFDAGGRSRHELAFIPLDGSGPTLMTKAEDRKLVAGQAAWSSNGSQVAFVVGSRHSWAFTGDGDLYVMNADGSDLDKLLPGIGITHPTWSPDGKQIAFVRDQGTALCIVNADGSGLKVIAKERGYYQLPSWSPLGDLIAYQSAGHIRDHEAIFTIRPDGSNEHRLLRSRSSTGFPSWSPDGTQLAYSGGDQLRIFDLSTARSRLVTRCALPACVADFFPAWSPDGSRIVFVRQEEGGAALHLYVVDLSTERITRLPVRGRSNSDPSWRP